ncbi:MAG TPA: AzlD domain-containing protein [Candidatus Limnocylindrales bacterium]|nr:AzlD domain-containing protein [Candidatus Limnocylindrales bacterium]
MRRPVYRAREREVAGAHLSYWVAIAAGGLATYLTRLAPLVVSGRGTAPDLLRRYLDLLPIAVIAALAGAGIAMPDGQPTGGAEIGAAAVALAVALWRKNLLFAVIAGVVVVAGLRALGL